MFLISLAIFTFILTVFENVFLAFGVLILILIIYFFINKKIHPGAYFLIIGAFILSLTSILIKNYTYSQKQINIDGNGTGLISQNLDGPQGNYFVGTGEISDIYSYQKYIFEDNGGREYFLNSKKKYQIGDKIRLNGYVSPAYTGAKNIFDLRSQRKQIRSRGQSAQTRNSGGLLETSSISGFFAYEFDYPKRLMMKGFYGTIFEQNSVVMQDPGVNSPLYSRPRGQNLSFLQKIRKSLQEKIIHTYGENPQAGLILGMLIGDKSQIPPNEYKGFIDSGLVHIIAVSGGNIIMIVVFLGLILFFLPFYVRNAVILATIIVYAAICGLDSSVFRATIMGGLGMLALFRGREVDIWRAMSIAFVIMLSVNPYFLAYDVGFLLSFSAIIGIVYFEKWVETIRTPGSNGQGTRDPGVISKVFHKIIKEYISPTLGATLGVLPVMLFFMEKMNLTGIIANFLVAPIVAVVMIYGFVSTMLFQILPWQFILWPEKILITYIYSISDLAGKRGLYLQADGVWIKYALLMLFIIWFVSERMKKDEKIDI